nr:putative ribonuclease H-like domain-containing protein [Tanacetum cinerariifolium]
MDLPDKHQLKFNIHKDAKSLMEAIEKRFGGNEETKSTNESVSAVASVFTASTKVLVSALPNEDTLSDAIIYSFFASQSNSLQLDNEDIKQIDADDLEEMDLKWQMSILTMKARTFLQRTGRNLGSNGTTSIGFDMSKVEYYNCHKRWHLTRECRLPKDARNKDTSRRNVPVETSTSNELVSQCDEPTNYALMAFTSLSSSSSDNKVVSCSKAYTKAYATLQSHYDKLTNDLRKSQFDVLSYKIGLESVDARIVVYQQNETVFEKDIKLLKLDVMLRDNALVKLRKKFEKAEQERDKLKLKLDKFLTSSKNLSQLLASQTFDKTGLGYDNPVFTSTVFDNDELISFDFDVSMPPSPVHDRYQSGEGYHAVPPLYTGTFMPPKPNLVFYDALTANDTVPTVLNIELSTTKPNQDLYQTQRPSDPIIEDWISDSEDDTEAINGGYVAFGGNPKGGKITGKGKIRTGKLDFNDVYFVKELKFNLFSVSQMCDKKNSVLFIDTECIVLSSDFKLPDDNHVLLRVPKENNMYNVDLKNIVPSGDLTCLFTKATLDDSNLWHRRLGHINFKTMNKLVKGHLPQICLMMTLEGFPLVNVNTKEYHSECSGNYHKDNA